MERKNDAFVYIFLSQKKKEKKKNGIVIELHEFVFWLFSKKSSSFLFEKG